MEPISIHQQLLWGKLIGVALLPVLFLFVETKSLRRVRHFLWDCSSLRPWRVRDDLPVQYSPGDHDQGRQWTKNQALIGISERPFNDACGEFPRCQRRNDPAQRPPEPAHCLTETPDDYRQGCGQVNARDYSTGEQGPSAPRFRRRRIHSHLIAEPMPTRNRATEWDRENPVRRLMDTPTNVTAQENSRKDSGNCKVARVRCATESYLT